MGRTSSGIQLGNAMEATSQTTSAGIVTEGPKGLGGWLILPIIYLVATLLLTSYNLLYFIQDWESLVALATGQVDPSYRWLFWPLLISAVLGVVVIAYALYLLVIIFQKKRELPRLMIWYYVVMMGVTVFESGLVFQYPEFRSSTEDMRQASNDLVRAAFSAAIWIPYFLRSKRVQATFVN